MRKAIFLLSCLSTAHAWAACDSDAVKAERASMQGFGTLHEGKQAAEFRWRPQFDGIAPMARVALMKQIAWSERCAAAKPREIDFYLSGKLIARGLADGRYQAVSETFAAQEGPQIKFWFRNNSK